MMNLTDLGLPTLLAAQVERLVARKMSFGLFNKNKSGAIQFQATYSATGSYLEDFSGVVGSGRLGEFRVRLEDLADGAGVLVT
jgi:hypothetical protein